jgi:antirestriction protein
MSTSTATPRVCFQCLAAYNSGILHFKWFDATSDPDDLWSAIKEVLATSPIPGAEEWMIADYEGFGPWRLSEWETIEHVALVTEGIEEYGEAFAAWVANDESVLRDGDKAADYSDLEESFRDSYAGTWDSEEEYAREFVSDCGLPGVGFVKVEKGPDWQRREEPRWSETLDELDSILDWDSITRQIMDGCWTHEHDGKVDVFWDV